MAGIECIGRGYKDLLENLISKDVAQSVLISVLGGMSICEPLPSTLSTEGAKEVVASRAKATTWGIPVDYTNERGETKGNYTPSGLIKELNLKMSGVQTLCDDTKCKAVDVVDIFRLQGFIVACEDEKGLTLDCRKAAEGGKAMHVIHPAVITMKKPAFSKLPEQIRQALDIGKAFVRE